MVSFPRPFGYVMNKLKLAQVARSGAVYIGRDRCKSVNTDKKTLRTDAKPIASGCQPVPTDQKPVITD